MSLYVLLCCLKPHTYQMRNVDTVIALSNLTDFLHNVLAPLEESPDFMESKAVAQALDPLIQDLNIGCQEHYFIDPPLGPPLSSLFSRRKPTDPSSVAQHPCRCSYPLLRIDMAACRNALIAGASTQHVQFIIARFIEKTFCRVVDTPPYPSCTCALLSHIALLIDFCGIRSTEAHGSSWLCIATAAVTAAVHGFSALLVKAVIVVGAARAGAAVWRPLSVGLAGDGVRLLLCDSMDETGTFVHPKE